MSEKHTDKDTSAYSDFLGVILQYIDKLPPSERDGIKKFGEFIADDLIEKCPEWCFICKKYFPCEHFETSWKDRNRNKS